MPRKGILFILIATLSFAVMNVLAKSLSDFHFSQVVFLRAIGTLILVLPFMLYKGVSLVGNNPSLLMLRAFTGMISLATFFMAIQIIPLGSAISIRYLGPLFSAILATIFLKELVHRAQWLCFALAFVGVAIVKGFDVRVSIIGLVLSLISAFFLGFVFVVIRFLATREHYMTIIFYFVATCAICSLFFIQHWRLPIAGEWYAAIFIGIVGFVGQVFMTLAFSLEEASVLAPFKYMEIVYALIMGLVFFGESYTMIAALGMGLIIVGMIMNVIIKSRLSSKLTT